MRLTVFILLFATFFLSCSKDSSNQVEYSYLNKSYYNNLKPEFKSSGNIIGTYIDELLIDGSEQYLVRLELYKLRCKNAKSENEVYSLISDVFKADKEIVSNYFTFLKVNNDMLSKSSNKKSLQDGILFYGYSSQIKNQSSTGKLEQRGLFGFIANVFHAGCTGQIVSQTLDVVIEVGGVIASGGVGLIGGTAIAADFANTVHTAATCND